MTTRLTLLAALLLGIVAASTVQAQIPGGSYQFYSQTPTGDQSSATAFTQTTLQLVRGSGEFQTFEISITLTKPEALTMRWSTNQTGATGGTWQVTNIAEGTVVASGEAGPTPAPNQFARFTIDGNVFLFPSPPTVPVRFNITIVPHDAANKPLGNASAPVVVTQEQEGPQTSFHFGSNAVFPSVSIISYKEVVGVVPQTQLHFAGADVVLRVTNNGKTTDPMWLEVRDANLLMRQTSPTVKIPKLTPFAWQLIQVHLDAILPSPKSQMPARSYSISFFVPPNCGRLFGSELTKGQATLATSPLK